MDTGEPAIETFDITKHFGDLEAVQSVNIEIDRGEVFGLLGPNGAGKTTLVNMLVGLVEPTRGTANVLGKDIKKEYREVHASIGLAPTENNFDREFDVFDNLKHHAGYFGFDRNERKRRAERYLKKFDLWDKRKEKPFSLSSGMKKKLLIARAMVTDPEILILDEPTAALDVETRNMIHQMILDLAKEGLTIILTTHYIREAQKLCERVAIMNEGQIIADDSPKNLIKTGKHDRLKIKLNKKIKNIPNKLEEISEQARLDGNNQLEIKAKDANKLAPKAIKTLLRKNIEINSIEIEESNLEDIFSELT
ncbi:ABC transporter ATP-binding protein [archaeon SCG-AAA382B04]|nr:ABC transporter ATP-binding protein [archaeon SCG-AAA382B04]